jgi:oligogalacturonide lyase
MKVFKSLFVIAFCFVSLGAQQQPSPQIQPPPKPLPQQQPEPPREWIDPDTGHRVIRLSDEAGSASLYFHQNPYTPDGKKLLITVPNGLATVDLKTRQIDRIVDGRVNVIIAGHKTGAIYYVKQGVVYATDPNTRQTREIAKLPPAPAGGSIGVNTVNADETLLAGTITEGRVPNEPAPSPQQDNRNAPNSRGQSGADNYPGKGDMMERRLAARLPMQMFTLNVRTGEFKTILRSTDWLNHLQFSPTDPNMLLFCHEGPWHKVDRTWIIKVDGTGLTKLHTRTMNMEIEGHEFWGADGKKVWYDLQTPKSQVFWLASYDLGTGQRMWYNLPIEEWSVHFNVSPDGKLFAGDGGGPNSVAAGHNGQWIYLFRPQERKDWNSPELPDAQKMIKTGFFKTEKLVNLAKHDYRLEPNVTFTPDMKWIVFRSNMFGPTHVFAVEIEKAQTSQR